MAERRAASRKWLLLGLFWLFQAGAFYALWAAMLSRNWSGFGRSLSDREYALWAISGILIISTLQGLFVLPVRQPAPLRDHGWPIRISLAIAALSIAAMGLALLFAVGAALELGGLHPRKELEGLTGNSRRWAEILLPLATAAMLWAEATVLLIAFCRRGRRETILSRVAALVFTGTMIETAAIIPLDVMVRRRESCYCDTGTFFALNLLGTVGIFALGPAVFLPILSRRRKRWYEGRCEACGYDMRGTPGAPRCPECGAGWRAERRKGEPQQPD